MLSIFKPRTDAATSAASGPADAVQSARIRARQRLIGAVILVIIGIVGFPLVFETQPRPIPVDIPIEVPRKDGAPALVMPPARPAATTPTASAPPPKVERPAASNDVITESREEAGRDVPASGPAAATSEVRATPAPTSKPTAAAPIAAATPPAKPAAEPKPSAPIADATRAKALLEGKPAAASLAGRFVVQVGAFADASAAHDTRVKAEKLGLKTYTQVASTAAGNRIRVRVGPFGTRDEADKAMSKARAAGLTAVVLTL